VKTLYERDPFARWVSLASIKSPAGEWRIGMLEPLNAGGDGFIQAFLTAHGWVQVITASDFGPDLSADAAKLAEWLKQSRIWDREESLVPAEWTEALRKQSRLAAPSFLQKPKTLGITDQEWKMIQLQIFGNQKNNFSDSENPDSSCPFNPSGLGIS
jgi:hypothetical protein